MSFFYFSYLNPQSNKEQYPISINMIENNISELKKNIKIKRQILVTLFLVCLISMNGCQKNRKSLKTKNSKIQNSVLTFRTDTTKFYSLTSINPETGKWIPEISQKVNYHKIDTRDKSLTFFFKLKNQTVWDIRKMHYDSLSVKKNGTKFYYNSDYFISSFLDTLSSNTIAHLIDDNHYIRFINLKRIENSKLDNLKLKKETSDSYQKQEVNSKQQYQQDDFEYSDYWRKKAFKKTIQFIKQKLKENTPSCLMVSRSTYNTNLVNYIGQKGYRIKLYVEFDCDKDYINPSYFWVDAFYLGENKWNLALIDQKLTH